jgi:hypothetical protein
MSEPRGHRQGTCTSGRLLPGPSSRPPRYYKWSLYKGPPLPWRPGDAQVCPRYSQAMFKKSLANLFLAHFRFAGRTGPVRHEESCPWSEAALTHDRLAERTLYDSAGKIRSKHLRCRSVVRSSCEARPGQVMVRNYARSNPAPLRRTKPAPSCNDVNEHGASPLRFQRG